MNRLTRKYLCLLLLLITIFPALPAATAEDAPEMPLIDFTNGTKQGFEPHGGTETLTVTDAEAYSGEKSLKVTGRTMTWHGPVKRIEYYITPGARYTVSVWVLSDEAGAANFRLNTQIGEGAGALYYNLAEVSISQADGWTELRGQFTYGESDYITVYVESDKADAGFYIDDLALFSSSGGPLASAELPSLKEAYKDYFLLASAFSTNDHLGVRKDLLKRHYTVLTSGNGMKPGTLSKGPGMYNFETIDDVLATLSDNGFLIHGHTLVWHQQSAGWLNLGNGGEVLTRAEAKANLETYITTVAGHFAGKVISWDVVNEAFQTSVGAAPADWRNALRKGGSEGAPWYQAYENGADASKGESGADYIYDAFVFARLADPDATLYYNDFNETYQGKREVIARMTEELNAQWADDPRNTEPDRLLIEGIGMQAHYWTDDLNPKDVEDSIVRFIQTGAVVGVSELDIPCGSWSNYKAITPELEQYQAELYAQLFMIYKKYAEHIERVTIWGIDDGNSWRGEGSPLLFDTNVSAKLAYYAVLDPEGFLEGKYKDIKNQAPQGENPQPIAAPDKTGGEQTSPSPAGGDGEVTPSPSDGTGDSGPSAIAFYLPFIGGGVVLIGLIVFFIARKR